jgi:hypothetical protein
VELESGNVGDKPFARLIYKLARQRLTGDLILEDRGREYRSSWEDGRVVAALSPSPGDSVSRVALNAGLATSSAVGGFIEQSRRQPDRDPFELFAEVARLRPAQIGDLRRRLHAQRALRIFALPGARYTVTRARSMRADPELPALDARWLIFQGIRLHYPVDRLEREMAALFHHRFRLAADGAGSLPAFGFTEADRKAIDVLSRQAPSISELVTACPELDRITVLAIVYALVASDCLEPAGQVRASAPSTAPTPSPNNPLTAQYHEPLSRQALTDARVRAAASARGSGPLPAARPSPPPTPPAQARSTAPVRAPARAASAEPDSAPVRRRRRSTAANRHSRAQKITSLGIRESRTVTANEVLALIASKLALIEDGADYFRVLGVPFAAGDSEVRIAYFRLAKRLHPDRLQALGLPTNDDASQRVFAAINHAFSVLSDRRKAAEYRLAIEARTSMDERLDEGDAEELAARIFAAEEAFRFGEMALKRNHIGEALERFEEAVELNPDEGEHHAYLAWTRWCAAADKTLVLGKVREGLSRASDLSPNSPTPYLLRARVARQRGDGARAEKLYLKVLSIEPGHSEAETELRILRQHKR